MASTKTAHKLWDIFFVSQHFDQVSAMFPKSSLLCRAMVCIAALVFIQSDNAVVSGQNWQTPEMQQPVPQYYPSGRYPLFDANGGHTRPQVTVNEAATQKAPIAAIEVPVNNPAHPSEQMQQKQLKLPAQPKQQNQFQVGDVAEELENRRRLESRQQKAVATKAQSEKMHSAKNNSKKAISAKSARKKVDSKKAPERHATLNWDVYRDRSKYPIDPRKPCSVCKRQINQCQCGRHHDLQLGSGGMPWQDTEPGGFNCGKKCQSGRCQCGSKRPDFSIYWPKPFSAKRANREKRCVGCGNARCNCKKVNDLFDHLADFSLIDYQRKDNGYCGPGADPYGCLGESRSRVAGVGFRFPSEPVQR